MNTDESAELFNEPRFIQGIYDYCDFWCEKCAFTAHCFRFAQRLLEGEQKIDLTDSPEDAQEIQQAAPQDNFIIAEELIERSTPDRDNDSHSSESRAELEKADIEHERKYAEVRAHPLLRASTAYAHSTYYWFDRREEGLQACIRRARTNNKLLSNAPLDVLLDVLFPEEIEDAIEVIRWHQFRAGAVLEGIFLYEDYEEAKEILAPMNDGQIKTVLIGLDHSLLAWGKLQMFWPERAEEMMRLTGLASELRLKLELAFPNARDFIRPGLDDASTMLM